MLLLYFLFLSFLSPLWWWWWWWIWGDFLPPIHALNLKAASPLLWCFRPLGEDGVLNVSLFPYSLLLPLSWCSHLPVGKCRAVQIHAPFFQFPPFSRRSMTPLLVHCTSVLAPSFLQGYWCPGRRKRLGKRPLLSTTRSFPLFSGDIYPCGKTGMSGLHTFHTLYSQFSFPLYWLGWAGLYELSTPHN